MADAGLVLACAGCCCGHPDKGGARIARSAWRRAFAAAGLEGRARLAFSDCLGPCSEANVVFVYLHGRPLWLRRINSTEIFAVVLAYARDAVATPGVPPPAALVERSFTWTGGGLGPEPV